MNPPEDMEILNEKAELLKALAHPVRLCIVRGLSMQGECNVNKMQACLHLPQSTISQHLAKLRTAGLIRARREGVEVFYQIAHPDLPSLMKTLFPVLGETPERWYSRNQKSGVRIQNGEPKEYKKHSEY